jgi:hypothetical protein
VCAGLVDLLELGHPLAQPNPYGSTPSRLARSTARST